MKSEHLLNSIYLKENGFIQVNGKFRIYILIIGDSEDDHFLHEFHSVEETHEQSTNNSTIEDFLTIIKSAKNYF